MIIAQYENFVNAKVIYFDNKSHRVNAMALMLFSYMFFYNIERCFRCFLKFSVF